MSTLSKKPQKTLLDKFNLWLPNIYYIAMISTLIFILIQVVYTKRNMDETTKWEKAKITMQITNELIANLDTSFIAATVFSKRNFFDKDRSSKTDMKIVFDDLQRIINNKDSLSIVTEIIRIERQLDRFAYPIVFGYAEEYTAFDLVGERFVACCVISTNLYSESLLNSHNMKNARLLFELWDLRRLIKWFKKLLTCEDEMLDSSGILSEEECKNISIEECRKLKREKAKRLINESEKRISEYKRKIENYRNNTLKESMR